MLDYQSPGAIQAQEETKSETSGRYCDAWDCSGVLGESAGELVGVGCEMVGGCG